MPAPTPDPAVVALWYHYEEIAMHFNQLLMQFRLQVLGGAGTLGTLAGYLIGEKVNDQRQRNWLRALISTGLWFLIFAAAILDLGYYSRLLRGAVYALLDFERLNPDIKMSTTIEGTVHGMWAPWLAYILLLSVLLFFILWAWRHFLANREGARLPIIYGLFFIPRQ